MFAPIWWVCQAENHDIHSKNPTGELSINITVLQTAVHAPWSVCIQISAFNAPFYYLFWHDWAWRDLLGEINSSNETIFGWTLPVIIPNSIFALKKKRLKRGLNVIDSEYSLFYKEPKESGHSLQLLVRIGKHTEWSALRRERERENVAGNQRERMRKTEDGSHCENHFQRFFTQQYFCRGCHI